MTTANENDDRFYRPATAPIKPSKPDYLFFKLGYRWATPPSGFSGLQFRCATVRRLELSWRERLRHLFCGCFREAWTGVRYGIVLDEPTPVVASQYAPGGEADSMGVKL